ncbi:hypothetical protein SAMN02745121_05055 [Nannocystis exedens]|uniref:Uncharacterized protein n=1 Tax=Nannocystis exedens TaxID=54 RepID=A0A1I2CCJ6_9BACT|nr:hypothetical protein [Nannocystis exedens]PCC68379.1 hypothetical protein NAEX_01389 [Nannocystis exedens]SFE65948.1 hypothetical protein SAMN02745121_05055 [Nannocystis exedens]
MQRLTTLMAALALAGCPQDSGDETGGTETTGSTSSTTTAGTSEGSTTAVTTTDTTGPTTGETTGPTTGETTDPTTGETTDETAGPSTTEDPTEGVCALPPLSEEVVSSLGFNVFGQSYEAKPGQMLDLSVGAIECCYIKMPVEACVAYSVSPAEGATINAAGALTIAADVAPGTVFTVTADVEAGRKVLTTEVFVYTPETNPFVGIWHEVAQLPCGGGAEVAPESAIQELWFRASGEVRVTWFPFEVYFDYWSDYTYDLETGDLTITPTGGNYVPADVEGVGTFSIEGSQLVLQDMWLGSPQNGMQPANCGHRFER